MRSYRKLIEAQESLKSGEFIVGKDISEDGYKRYYVFVSLREYLIESERKESHFYEIVNGRQRIYFDVDIPHDKLPDGENGDSLTPAEVDTMCDDFIDRFIVFMRKTIKDVQINIYTSHTQKRHSYHIVLINKIAKDQVICAQNAIKIVHAYRDCYTKITGEHDDMLRFFDLTLYKRSQLFRLLGSCKMGKDNIKTMYKCDVIGKDKLEDLKNSLICHYL